MKKILVFCANPVDGGTAQIFFDVSRQLQSILGVHNVVPCVNQRNCVKIYNELETLVRLPVYSENEIWGILEHTCLLKRIIRKVYRVIRYHKYKKNNIRIFREYVTQNRFDAVVIHNGGYLGDDLCNQLLEAAYLENVSKRIMVFHNDMKKNRLYKLYCMRYDNMINCCATQTVTVSNFTKNRILRESYLNKNMKVIYNGISVVHRMSYEQKKKILNFKEGEFCVGMVGNFQHNKGQLDFLKVIRNLIKNGIDVQAVMIGNIYDKAYYEECVRFVQMNALENVVSIHQGIYNAKEYYCLFDVTVVPSLYDESFGLIGAESLLNGTPVVAYACGGIPEVIDDGNCGFVVPVGDQQSLTDKLVFLHDNANTAAQMGEEGRRRCEEKFSIENMGKAYAKLLIEKEY